jgi:23S rRNA (uracil1939-C5)-methyltransferase
VVALSDCMVLHPDLQALLTAGLRLDTPGAEVTLRVSTSHTGCTASFDAGSRLDGPDDVLRAIDAGPDASLHQRVGQVDLTVSAASFFQSGPDAADLLVDHVRRAAGPIVGRVVDAFGGVGLFSATLGVTDGVLIETSPSAVCDARRNVQPGVRVVQAPVEAWTPERADLVIADPSRRGLEAGAVDVLVDTGAARIVLVSCDPAAAARDGTRLVDHGYIPRGARVLDLFPQTHHVEVVARYDRCHTDETEFW